MANPDDMIRAREAAARAEQAGQEAGRKANLFELIQGTVPEAIANLERHGFPKEYKQILWQDRRRYAWNVGGTSWDWEMREAYLLTDGTLLMCYYPHQKVLSINNSSVVHLEDILQRLKSLAVFDFKRWWM